METIEQAHARAVAILGEFSISPNVLRVLRLSECPLHCFVRNGQHFSDGRFSKSRTGAALYRDATYLVFAVEFLVETVYVRQDFDADKLRGALRQNATDRVVWVRISPLLG